MELLYACALLPRSLASFFVAFGLGGSVAKHECRVSWQEKEERAPPHKEFLEGKEKPSLGFVAEVRSGEALSSGHIYIHIRI